MLPTGNYNGYAFRDDPRGFKKKNGLARGLSKHAPLIAILMALLMGGGGLLMGWRLQRMGGDLRKATAHVDDLEHRLTAAQQAGDSNRDLAAQRYRQIESLSDSLFRVKGDLQEKNRHMDERDRRVAELQNEVAELKRSLDLAVHAHGENANHKSELELLRSRMDILMNAASERDRQLSELQRRCDTDSALHRRRELDWEAHARDLETQLAAVRSGDQHLSPAAWAAHAANFAANDPHQKVDGQHHQPTYDARAAHPAHDVAPLAGGTAQYNAHGGTTPPAEDLHPDHAGFVTVAELLDAQGITDPKGVQHFAGTLAKFFEEQMAAMMFKVESGANVRDTPSHEISTMLVTLLNEQGVISAHGTQHMFATVDHLVDAALTHWAPSPATPADGTAAASDTPVHYGSAGHHAATPGAHLDNAALHVADLHAQHHENLRQIGQAQQDQQQHHQQYQDGQDAHQQHQQQQHQEYHDPHQQQQHQDYQDPHHQQQQQYQHHQDYHDPHQGQQQQQQHYDDHGNQELHVAQYQDPHGAQHHEQHQDWGVPTPVPTHYGSAGHVGAHDAAGRKGFGDGAGNPAGGAAGTHPAEPHQSFRVVQEQAPHKPDSAGFVL